MLGGGEREATGSLLLTTRAAPRSPNAYNDRISISVGVTGITATIRDTLSTRAQVEYAIGRRLRTCYSYHVPVIPLFLLADFTDIVIIDPAGRTHVPELLIEAARRRLTI